VILVNFLQDVILPIQSPNKENFIYLGRKKNKRYANYRKIKGKGRYRLYQYKKNNISLMSLVTSIKCYENLYKNK